MKIKSVQTAGKWLELQPSADESTPDVASSDLRRVLSSAVRSQNLVILTGLGTSLCVTDNGTTAAPTMWKLLTEIKKLFEMIDLAEGKPAGSCWTRFAELANVAADCEDLEFIMSRATVASEFLSGGNAAEIGKLLSVAEDTIRKQVDFMKDSIELPVHESFLRRVARRSARRART